MNSLKRMLSVGLAFAFVGVVVVYVSQELASFLEQDACIDISGTYDSSTGSCTVPHGEVYVPQFSRTNSYPLWTFFVSIQFLVGISTFKIYQYFLGLVLGRKHNSGFF